MNTTFTRFNTILFPVIAMLSTTNHLCSMEVVFVSTPKKFKHHSLLPIRTSGGRTFHLIRALLPTSTSENLKDGIDLALDAHTFVTTLGLKNLLNSKKADLFDKIIKKYSTNSLAKMAQACNDLGRTDVCAELLKELVSRICSSALADPRFDLLVSRVKIPTYRSTDETIRLITADNTTFQVNKHLACLSNTIKHLAEDCGTSEDITLSTIHSSTLATILKLLEGQGEDRWSKLQDVPLDFNPTTFPQLLCALNYLDIPWLLQYVNLRLAMYIYAKRNYAQLAQLLEVLTSSEKNNCVLPSDITRLITSTLKRAYKNFFIKTAPLELKQVSITEMIYAVSSDGNYGVGVTPEDTLFLWDFSQSTARPIICPDHIYQSFISYASLKVTFSKDNRYLLLGLPNGSHFLYDVTSDSLTPSKIFSQFIHYRAAFTPDNKHIVLISHDTINLLDLTKNDQSVTTKKTFNMKEIADGSYSLITCNNEECLVLVQPVNSSQKMIVRFSYDSDSPKIIKTFEQVSLITSVAGNEKYLLAAICSGLLSLYDIQKEASVSEPLAQFNLSSLFDNIIIPVNQLTMSHDGNYAILGLPIYDESLPSIDYAFILIDLQQESPDFFLPVKVIKVKNEDCKCCTLPVFCKDRNHILLAHDDKLVKLSIFGNVENLALPSLVLKMKLLQEKDPNTILQVPYFDTLHKNMPKEL